MNRLTSAQVAGAFAVAQSTLGGDAIANDASTSTDTSPLVAEPAQPQLALQREPARTAVRPTQPPLALSEAATPSVGVFKSITMLLAGLFQRGVDFQGWAPPEGYLDDAIGLVREHLDFVLIGQQPSGRERLAAVNAVLWGASAAGPVSFWAQMKGEGQEEAIASDLRAHRHGTNMTGALDKAISIELPQVGDDPYGRFRFLMDQPTITPKPLFLFPFTNYGVETLIHDDAPFGVASIPYYNAALRVVAPNRVEIPYQPGVSMPLPPRMHLDASMLERQKRMFDVFEQILRRRRTALVLTFGLKDVQRMQTMAEYHQKLGRPVIAVPIAREEHVAMVVGTPACAPVWRLLEADHRAEVVFWEPPAHVVPPAETDTEADQYGWIAEDLFTAALVVLAQAGVALVYLCDMRCRERAQAARERQLSSEAAGRKRVPRTNRRREPSSRPAHASRQPGRPAAPAQGNAAAAAQPCVLHLPRERDLELKEIARHVATEIPLVPHDQTLQALRGPIRERLDALLAAGDAAEAAAVYCGVVDLAMQEAPQQVHRWIRALGVRFADIRRLVEAMLEPARKNGAMHPATRRLEKALDMLKPKAYLALDAEACEDASGRGWLGPARRQRAGKSKARPSVVLHARAVGEVEWTQAEIYQHAKAMAGAQADGAAPLALLRDDEVFISPRPEDRPHLHVKKDVLVFKKPDGTHWDLVEGDRSYPAHIQSAREMLREDNPGHAGMLRLLDFLESGRHGAAQ